jgi:predicted RNA-binding Zn ribbon-like protein
VVKKKLATMSTNPTKALNWTQFQLLGGRLCLDFVNTVNREVDRTSEEWLYGYADLIAWSQQTQIFSDKQAKNLLQEAIAHPQKAQSVFERAIALRETLYAIFGAIAQKQPVPEKAIARFNNALAQTLVNLQIMPSERGYTWTWKDCDRQLDVVLWEVIRSAGELLTAKEMNRLRKCAADDCSFLFVDTSRNGSRCWCDMKDCGNRYKAKQYYRRQKH